MSLESAYKELLKYKSHMRFNAPASAREIELFEQCSGWIIPPQLKELLQFFDGGEIFIPGTKVYGISTKNSKTLYDANSQQMRSMFHVPENHIIFARLNFGDLLCINCDKPYEIVQWDHESDKEYDRFESMEEWLKSEIEWFENDAGDVL